MSEEAKSSPDVNHYKYVIIGAGMAAAKAVEGIRTKDPEGRILVVSEEPDAFYVRPPLSKELWKSSPEELAQLIWTDINGTKGNLMMEKKEDFNLEIRIGEVTDLDAEHRAILIGEKTIISYDKCLIATGAVPRNILTVAAENQEAISGKIQTYRTLKDFHKLLAATQQDGFEKVAVLGGGILGTELAFALAEKVGGGKVVQVFPEDGPLANILPSYLSKHVADTLQQTGASVQAGLKVVGATPDNGKVKLELSDGSSTTVDHVVVAAGVTPNTALARRAELEIDANNGGIVANAELLVRSNLWAAGDVVSYYDVVADKRLRVEHFDTAHFTGLVAGMNMAEQSPSAYLHHPFWWSDCGPSIAMETVGIADSQLETVGVFEEPAGEYKRGVVYYLSNDNNRGVDRIVGILCFNLFDRVEHAVELIRKGRSVKDRAELKTLIHFLDEDPNEYPEPSQSAVSIPITTPTPAS